MEVAGLHHDVARSLELPSIDDVTDPQGKAFRLFAEQTQSDPARARRLLCAARARRCNATSWRSRAPVPVAAGTRDDIAGSPAGLAALFPDGQALDIPNRDHMVAVGDRVFKAAVLEFLKNRP